MNVNVNTEHLRQAATDTVYLPGLLDCVENAISKYTDAQVGTTFIGASAQWLFETAAWMNSEVASNQELVAAGLIAAADAYDAVDEDGREKVDESFELDDDVYKEGR